MNGGIFIPFINRIIEPLLISRGPYFIWTLSIKSPVKVFAYAALKLESTITIVECQEPPFINLMKPSRQAVWREHGGHCQPSRLRTSSEVNEPLCGLRGE